MKHIEKKAPPESLETYKQEENAAFKRLPSPIKKALKLQLIDEQGGLCCYCGNRITYETSNIEHFKPKDDSLFPELQLEYSNLFSSCLGGQIDRQTNSRFPLSCDAKKNNSIIDVCPTDPDCEEQFMYDDDGNIYGCSDKARTAIAVLGLNNEVIKNRRKAAIDAYLGLGLTTDEWKSEIEHLSCRDKNGLFEPYCFAVIYYIKHYIILLAA